MTLENITVKKFVVPDKYKPVLGAAGFYVIMMTVFIYFAPSVFLNVGMFTAVFYSLPLFMIMGLSLVFVTVAGEIDLSFPSILALTGLIFALTLQASDLNFWLAFSASLITGISCGLLNGFLVTKLGFSSLITTLGVNFMFAGVTQVLNRGQVRQIPEFDDSPIRAAIVGSWGPIPAQLLWGLAIAMILGLIFNRHRFGFHVHIAGDNPEAGRAMGVNVSRVKVYCFVLVGICCSITSTISILINSTFYSTMGEGYLLPVLAAVFVGGTPVTGGKGTIAGLVIGATTVVFINTGVIAVGLDGYFTGLGFGLVIILSLLGHRALSGRLSR
ncbi:MAG: ABC transporter permease [Actinobacteria bacterium]|nr:ABC transporter permease [Actinomycetota bacterium]